MKHQKSIPAKLFLHIYKKTNTHLNTVIVQLIAGEFLSGMRSCEYSNIPKGEDKRTQILQKENIQFYRKRRELPHESGILHLSNKVFPAFLTEKIDFKNTTVTQ